MAEVSVAGAAVVRQGLGLSPLGRPLLRHPLRSLWLRRFLRRPRSGQRCKKASEEFSKVYNQRSEFMKEDRTGFVWLYLQK